VGAPNLFLALGAIEPRYTPVWHASVLVLSQCLTSRVMSQYHSFVITLGGADATRPTYYILAY